MESIQPFLDAPVDYSDAFDARVASLAQAISAKLDVSVRHETDMNYNPGQLLVIYLLSDGSVTTDERRSSYSLKIAVSSRGPLWAIFVFRKGEGSLEWVPSSVTDICGSDRGREVLQAIESELKAAGLSRVPDEILEELVPGRVTELDSLPATVRDLLFCELC